jgi:Xaa-Pro aminopeptidase
LSAIGRLDRLREELKENELDAILVSSAENRRYLSGFNGSAGYLFISRTEAVLATDFRYIEQAGRQAPGFRIERIPASPAWLPELASATGAKRVGFEAQEMTVGAHSAFVKAIEEASSSDGMKLIQTSDLVDKMRATKNQEEMALLQRAIEIADEAFEDVSVTIRPGMTEAQVAWELEKAMRERGAESVSFETIVGAGPNGALPHHRADGTVIRDGQPIVIDMGATYDGYCSDLTRTVCVGEPDETFRKVYGTVLRAQLAAEEQVRVGMTGEETDTISRDIIVEAGYGEYFGHSLGHGVGLAVHEYPHVGPRASDVIENGMMFTIEPGIYLPDWGGVRIEDIVVMEGGRARVLSKATKLELDG